MKLPHAIFSSILTLLALVALTVAAPGFCSAQTAADNAQALSIGFNGADFSGADDQIPYIDQFYTATEQYYASIDKHMPGVRRCHAYVSWDVALEPEGSGSPTIQGSRVWLESWLQAYSGHCDEALITFKWVVGVSCHYYTDCAGGADVEAAPQPAEVGNALHAFMHTSWPGWSGRFAFTPWNEPNNPGASGDGFNNSIQVPARTDADYYLAMRRYCTPWAHCEIAAGDFASNGNHYEDFIQHCDNDTTTLCASGSYIDTFKFYLAHDATAYGLPPGFLPENFSFHGWSDANDYLHYLQNGTATNCYTLTSPDCVTRLTYDAFSNALHHGNGPWNRVKYWDTEVGAGQNGNKYDKDPTNDQQAETAAFVLDLTGTVSNRFERLLYTRIWEPDGQWWSMFCSDGTTEKPSFTVWADREISYSPTGSTCP